MQKISLLEAKSKLPQLVESIESGDEDEIVIARDGQPAARLVPIANPKGNNVRFGLAKDLFPVPTDSGQHDAEIAELFYGKDE